MEDAVREMRDEIDELKTRLAVLESHDDADHGGAEGRAQETAEHVRELLASREAELERRIRETEASAGYKGEKNLDAEAFGTAP